MHKKKSVNYIDYLYIAPAVILISILFIWSIVFTVYISFFEWNGLGSMKFIGLNNYTELFNNANFIVSATNTLIWVLSSFITAFLIPLLLAILVVNSWNLTLFKNILYFPNALAGTVVALVMSILLSISGLPQIFKFLGFDSFVRNWLAIPYLNTFVMISVGLYQGVGLYLILFITGILGVDNSLIEAARIDGAKGFTLYVKIILPMISNTIQIVILMGIINSFKIFENVWVMTKGGPFRSSETLALTMYYESFKNGYLGYGSAIAVLLSVVMLLVSYFYLQKSFSAGGSQT